MNDRKWFTPDQASTELSSHSPTCSLILINFLPLPWVSRGEESSWNSFGSLEVLSTIVAHGSSRFPSRSKEAIKNLKSNTSQSCTPPPHAKLLPDASCSVCGNHWLGPSWFQNAVHFSDHLSHCTTSSKRSFGNTVSSFEKEWVLQNAVQVVILLASPKRCFSWQYQFKNHLKIRR